MVEWHSPEEAEAWWAELQDLKEEVTRLEKRLVATSRLAYGATIEIVVAIVAPTQRRYVHQRAKHYAELIENAEDETEIANYLHEFMKEIRTYTETG
jgi:hypothetical protein